MNTGKKKSIPLSIQILTENKSNVSQKLQADCIFQKLFTLLIN